MPLPDLVDPPRFEVVEVKDSWLSACLEGKSLVPQNSLGATILLLASLFENGEDFLFFENLGNNFDLAVTQWDRVIHLTPAAQAPGFRNKIWTLTTGLDPKGSERGTDIWHHSVEQVRQFLAFLREKNYSEKLEGVKDIRALLIKLKEILLGFHTQAITRGLRARVAEMIASQELDRLLTELTTVCLHQFEVEPPEFSTLSPTDVLEVWKKLGLLRLSPSVASLVERYELNDTTALILNEIERLSSKHLTEMEVKSPVRFKLVDPTPTIKVHEGKIRVIFDGRFVDIDRNVKPEDEIRAGALMTEFRALPQSRKAAINYLLSIEDPDHSKRPWDET